MLHSAEVLPKTELKPHLRKCWVIPLEQDGDFVAAMEDVFEVCIRGRNREYPLVCIDEQPAQLLKETHTSRTAYTHSRTGMGVSLMRRRLYHIHHGRDGHAMEQDAFYTVQLLGQQWV